MMARQKVRQHHEVIPATASTPEILVVRSSRRRRTVSAQPQEDGSIACWYPGRVRMRKFANIWKA